MGRSSNPKTFLSTEERQRVEDAIAAAEMRTSAEIKLVILRHCWDDIRWRAAKLFEQHGLCDTAQRNGVMILLVLANREFLIHGDEGIHSHVGQDFWDDVRDQMTQHFARGDFAEGLVSAVGTVGEELAAFFPWHPEDENELSNEVVYDEE